PLTASSAARAAGPRRSASASSNTMPYEFRLQTNAGPELEKVTALLRRVWPNNRRFDLKFIEWLYRDNPNGQAIGYNAFHGDDVAAHYVVVPFAVEIEGQIKKSALA